MCALVGSVEETERQEEFDLDMECSVSKNGASRRKSSHVSDLKVTGVQGSFTVHKYNPFCLSCENVLFYLIMLFKLLQ